MKRDPRPVIKQIAEAVRLLQSSDQAGQDKARPVIADLNRLGGGEIVKLLVHIRLKGFKIRGL